MAPAVVQVEAQVTDFSVTQTNSEKYLVIEKGTISGSLTPRTIMDNETGACKVATPHSIFRDVKLMDANTTIVSSGSHFDVAISQADLFAVNGEFEGYENHFEGIMNVDGEDYTFPMVEGDEQLDPEYDAQVFRAAFDCVENSEYVDTDDACFFEKTLATGAARLLVKAYGVITKTIDADTECGFDNKLDQIWEFVDTSLLGPAFTGEPVSVDWAVDQCVIGSNEREVVAEDCSGNVISIDGTANVTGTKTVTGQLNLSGTPLHPLNRRSAKFEFSRIDLSNFAAVEQKAGDDDVGPHLVFHSGTLTGMSHPVTGEAEDNPGAYFIKTPVSGFEAVSVDAQVTLHNDGKIFHLVLNASDLDAFNGSYGFNTNSLSGDLWVNGTRYRMSNDGAPMILNPEYDQDEFDATYVCKENLLRLFQLRNKCKRNSKSKRASGYQSGAFFLSWELGSAAKQTSKIFPNRPSHVFGRNTSSDGHGLYAPWHIGGLVSLAGIGAHIGTIGFREQLLNGKLLNDPLKGLSFDHDGRN